MIALISLLALIILGVVAWIISRYGISNDNLNLGEHKSMTIASHEFKDGEVIPDRHTCRGEDIIPSLEIGSIPADAKSLALIIDDPDAPNGDWVHLVAWNISPQTTQILAGQKLTDMAVGINDFGNHQYDGPCPPSGTHRYQFKVYALDSNLELDSSAGKKELLKAMENHVLDQAILTGICKK